MEMEIFGRTREITLAGFVHLYPFTLYYTPFSSMYKELIDILHSGGQFNIIIALFLKR